MPAPSRPRGLRQLLGLIVLGAGGLLVVLLYRLLPEGFPDTTSAYELEKLFVATGALAVALYTVFSRDERLRVNSENVFVTFIGFTVAAIFGMVAIVLRNVSPSPLSLFGARVGAFFGVVTYLLSLVFLLFYVFMRAYNRLYNLREDKIWKYFKPIRLWRRRFGLHKTYEYEVENRSMAENSFGPLEPLFPGSSRDRLKKGISILLLAPSARRLSDFAVDVILARVKAGDTANYVCADRHPRELWSMIEEKCGGAPADDLRGNVVLVDAYAQLFGFTDDIHEENERRLKDEGVACVRARTFAGVHTAVNKAFNIIKSREADRGRSKRRPMVMAYSLVSGLLLVESLEMYGIFWRHVVPSERSYGMLTLILEHESLAPEAQKALLPIVDEVFRWDEQSARFVRAGDEDKG